MFRNNVHVYWSLIDTRNPNRLALVNDVLGTDQDENRLTWDDIVACREQQIVSDWLKKEIDKIDIASSITDQHGEIIHDTAIIDIIASTIRLDTIESPRTIFHIAAAYNNVPVYRLFAKQGFPGQDTPYDTSGVNHANGRLPWEIAVERAPNEIGAFAKKKYLKWIKDETDNDIIDHS